MFEKWLLDAEWSLNAGNWMWLSCSAFFQQFFNCICPVAFGKKLDPNGDYIRLVKNFLTFIIKMLNAFQLDNILLFYFYVVTLIENWKALLLSYFITATEEISLL